MGRSKKEQIAYIQQLLQYDLSKGGMADFNKYNQFLCDIVPTCSVFDTSRPRLSAARM